VTHLYRKSRAYAIGFSLGVFLLLSSTGAFGQRPELRRPGDQSSAPSEQVPAKKSKRGARAIGVVEFLPGGATRLVPVALWIDGKYYDASLYQANPAPLAVEPGTVYEGQSFGEPAGLFVVNMPKLSNAGWTAQGNWTPRRAMDEQLAAQAAKQPKATAKQSKAIFTGGADEGPPVLRRPGEQSSSAPKNEPQSQPAATAASNTPPPTSDDNDPNRPVLRKPVEQTSASAAPPSQPPSTQPPNQNDSDRPLLTRGAQPTASAPKPATKAPVPGSEKATKTSSDKLHSLVAVSDAGKYENRSLLYTTTPERQQQLAQAMLGLALADVRAFADQHPTGPKVPKSAEIKDYDLRSFDLDFSNSATLVLTAKLPLPVASTKPFAYYVTFVAHLDINGDPVKAFSSVTDTSHLDVFPRLELVDALDADANGRGDLLFRQYSDTGINYGLYRVFPYQMEKIFEGGSSL